MHSGNEVRIVGNDDIDGRATDVRLVNDGMFADVLTADPDCLPLYPFRFWCLSDKPDKEVTEVPRDPALDTQTDPAIDVYTDAVGTEVPEVL